MATKQRRMEIPNSESEPDEDRSIKHKRKKHEKGKGTAPSNADKNTCASLMTEAKIRRYFGEVSYYSTYLNDKTSISGDTVEEILHNFIGSVHESNMPFSVSSVEEMENILDTIDSNFQSGSNNSARVKAFFEEMLKDIGNEENTPREDWFKALNNVCLQMWEDIHTKCTSEDTSFIPDLLNYLLDICRMNRDRAVPEALHSWWKNIWQTFVTQCVKGHTKDKAVYTKKNGDCVGKIKINPVANSCVHSSDSEGSSSEQDAPEITISTKPDFSLMGSKIKRTTDNDRCQFHILVAEVKTAKFDGDSNPLSESDFTSPRGTKKRRTSTSASDEPQRKKPAPSGKPFTPSSSTAISTHSSVTSQQSSQSTSHQTDLELSPPIQPQRHHLEHLKTQHFSELLGMLRTGNETDFFLVSWRMFGLYCTMNRAYITHLMPDVIDKTHTTKNFFFIMHRNSRIYHECNKRKKGKFSMATFGYFNLFKLSHVLALIKILKFIVWHEHENTLCTS